MTSKAKQQGQTAKILELRGLADQPSQQTAYALKLLDTERNFLVVDAALQVLTENFDPTARPTLLKLYQYYDEDGPKRDQGATIRATILRVLRDTAKSEDIPLLERAATTLEFSPPTEEIAMAVRSAALIVLNEVDSSLAAYHCVRLLGDEHSSKMSGEPAVTAARVLAAQHEYLPLYQYATGTGSKVAEVQAECIRNLTALPLSLLQQLVAQYRRTSQDVVLIGLFDLLLAHRDTANFYDYISHYLTTTRKYDVYRYLVLAILTSGQKTLIAKLVEIGATESDPYRLPILKEVLSLSGNNDVQVKTLIKKLKA